MDVVLLEGFRAQLSQEAISLLRQKAERSYTDGRPLEVEPEVVLGLLFSLEISKTPPPGFSNRR